MPLRTMSSSRHDRLQSFKNWPHKMPSLNPTLMSDLGCYYTDEADKVKCVFCGFELVQLGPNDNVMKEHIKYSNCPWMRQLAPPVAMDTCGR